MKRSTLEVQGLCYSYKKGGEVLRGLSFSASGGQCVCILGRNGAGKTTLFRCLLGMLSSHEGDILIDGVPAAKLSVREMARRVAYIPQAHAPTFNYTVAQTVLMGTNALMDGMRTPGEKERATCSLVLEQLGIRHLAQRGYAELSGGERQLVLIARALAQQSRILIMDEPTANLDYGNQLRVMRKVRKLADQGYLVLLSTHAPEHAFLYADRALVLQDGMATQYGPPREAVTEEVIRQIYGVEVEIRSVQAYQGEISILLPKEQASTQTHMKQSQ